MKKKDLKTGGLNDKAEAPLWLVSALRLAGGAEDFETSDFAAAETSDSFRLRCRQAAGQALAILKLRRERQRVGFLPVSLTDYMQGLMKVADVSPSQVAAPLGVEASASQTPEHVTMLGRLTREIGMSLVETLTHLRIGFAARHQSAPMTLLVAHRHAADPRRSQLEECEAVLSQIESQYDPKSMRDLRNIEQAISKAYQGGENTPT